MKNYFHGGIVMNGFLKHPYFAGTFQNGRNSSQAQKDFVGPGPIATKPQSDLNSTPTTMLT